MKQKAEEKQRKEITALKQELVHSKKKIKSLENKLSTSERKRKTLMDDKKKWWMLSFYAQ